MPGRTTLEPYLVLICNGLIAIGLSTDSRGYVLFTVLIRDDNNLTSWSKVSRPLTSEYLVDLSIVTAAAWEWIETYCTDIKTEDNRHLYFQFKGLQNV